MHDAEYSMEMLFATSDMNNSKDLLSRDDFRRDDEEQGCNDNDSKPDGTTNTATNGSSQSLEVVETPMLIQAVKVEEENDNGNHHNGSPHVLFQRRLSRLPVAKPTAAVPTRNVKRWLVFTFLFTAVLCITITFYLCNFTNAKYFMRYTASNTD